MRLQPELLLVDDYLDDVAGRAFLLLLQGEDVGAEVEPGVFLKALEEIELGLRPLGAALESEHELPRVLVSFRLGPASVLDFNV